MKEQARELLAVPDRSALKGSGILRLLVGCALRQRELALHDVGESQLRANSWVIADRIGAGLFRRSSLYLPRHHQLAFRSQN